MPDLNNFAVTRTDAANINVPTHQFAATVTDSSTGATIADFTGPNVISWPSVLATLSPVQQDQIAQQIAQKIVLIKAGL
jgi:hypothetical protein